MKYYKNLLSLVSSSIAILLSFGIFSASAGVEDDVDAALAARGLIQSNKIGKISEKQRAQALNKLMTLEAEFMQQPGVFVKRRLNLALVQNRAFGQKGWKIQYGAIAVARAGLTEMHMAEEVRSWLESNKPNQIKMAQAVLDIQSTGKINKLTFSKGNAYIRGRYDTFFSNLKFIQNITGSISPKLLYRAANEGRIYIPDVETQDGAEILKVSGLTKAQIAIMKALESAKENPPAPGVKTREQYMAELYRANSDIYTRTVTARNKIASKTTLDPKKAKLSE